MSAPPPPLPGGIDDAGDIPAPTDPILTRLLEYWDSKRGGRSMPSRADMDPPVELRGLTRHVILYDVIEPGSLYRIRLVGEAIVDFAGVNATGKFAAETLPPHAAKRMQEILNSVVGQRAPRFRAGYAHWHRDKSYHKFEACFLPLSPDDRTVDKILAGVTFATT
jgi:hypothetical protein